MPMINRRLLLSKQAIAVAIFLMISSLSFGRALLRTQTTLIGYEIGSLKKKEAELLAERSLLNMELAKLTTRQHLQLLSEEEKKSVSGLGEYATR